MTPERIVFEYPRRRTLPPFHRLHGGPLPAGSTCRGCGGRFAAAVAGSGVRDGPGPGRVLLAFLGLRGILRRCIQRSGPRQAAPWGLRVVSEPAGVPITGAQAVLRNLVGTVDGLVPFFFMLGEALRARRSPGKFQRLGEPGRGNNGDHRARRSPDSVCSVFRSRACGPSSTVCRCGSGPARTWRGPCLIMSGVVTGSAAPSGKRWPSRWPGRSGLEDGLPPAQPADVVLCAVYHRVFLGE